MSICACTWPRRRWSTWLICQNGTLHKSWAKITLDAEPSDIWKYSIRTSCIFSVPADHGWEQFNQWSNDGERMEEFQHHDNPLLRSKPRSSSQRLLEESRIQCLAVPSQTIRGCCPWTSTSRSWSSRDCTYSWYESYSSANALQIPRLWRQWWSLFESPTTRIFVRHHIQINTNTGSLTTHPGSRSHNGKEERRSHCENTPSWEVNFDLNVHKLLVNPRKSHILGQRSVTSWNKRMQNAHNERIYVKDCECHYGTRSYMSTSSEMRNYPSESRPCNVKKQSSNTFADSPSRECSAQWPVNQTRSTSKSTDKSKNASFTGGEIRTRDAENLQISSEEHLSLAHDNLVRYAAEIDRRMSQ